MRADAFGQERVAGFLCLGPHSYVRFKPHMLAGVPQLWFQPVVAASVASVLRPCPVENTRAHAESFAGTSTSPLGAGGSSGALS